MDVGTLKIVREKPLLVRGLGLWAATAIVIGGMIGQSVFLVASDMSLEVGSLTKVLVAWIVGGAIVLFGSFCYAELGAAMPEAGGDYVYQSRGLTPLCGFLYGWTSSMIMRPGSAAIIAAGLVRFVGFLLPPVTQSVFTLNIRLPLQSQPYQFAFTYAQPLAALGVVLVVAMNYLGVRTVGHFQTFLTALKLVAVALILALGFAGKNATGVEESHFTLPHGSLVAFLTALVPVMAAYNGFQGLGPLGGEVLNPKQNLPRAAILGTSLVIFLYLLINWMYFHLLGFSEVAHSQHVASDVVALLIGQTGAKWFTIAMIVSAFGALHANFLIGPRVPYAMARDGNFFAFASRIQPTFHSPSGALIFQGCIAVLLVLTGTHQELYSYTMFATWMFLGLTATSLVSCLGIPMDAIGLCHFGFRNLRKSMAGQARAIICGTGDYPCGRSFLLLLAQAQRHLFAFGRSCRIPGLLGSEPILSESSANRKLKMRSDNFRVAR